MEPLGVKATRRPTPPPAPPSGPVNGGARNGAADGRAGAGGGAAAPAPATDGARTVYSPQCPAQKALEAIASKWAILIMHRLRGGPVRFNALQRDLYGISQKVLTQQLRRLERFGLVHREVRPTVPPSVEYSLTAAGEDLKIALKALCQWAETHAVALGGGGADGRGAAGAG